MTTSFDVAVIGGGPAGIAAAAIAAEQGKRVVIIDESPRLGGQIWRHRAGHAIPDARRWIERVERSGAERLDGATVFDVHDDGANGFALGIERSGVSLRHHARAIVIATGRARERFVPFPGWTLPGVIGIGGAQALLKSGASFAGKQVVIGGSGPLLLPVAAALAHDGARVRLVAEQAPLARVASFAAGLWARPSALIDAARYRAGFLGTPYRTGEWISEARGDGALREVVVTDGRRSRTIACDVLCTGYGLVPSAELALHIGCATPNGIVTVDDRQITTVPNVFCAGEPTGIGGVDLALIEGEIAGRGAAGREDASALRVLQTTRASLRTMAAAMDRAFALRDDLRTLATSETIVCRCEDVPLGAIDRAWTPRQAKLYTRAGMGPCQGRVCGAALSFVCGWPHDAVRLPIAPTSLGALTNSE